MTASRYAVQSIPALLCLKRVKSVDRLVGALPKPEIESRLRGLLQAD